MKPKILLVTNLYPKSTEHSVLDTTRALHHFVTRWSKNAEVMVIRPKLRLNLWDFRPSNLFSRSVRNDIDGIAVHSLIYMDAPRVGIYRHNSFLKLLARERFNPDIIISHRIPHSVIGDKLSTILSIPQIIGIHSSCIITLREYIQTISKTGGEDISPRNYIEILSRTDRIACRSLSIKNQFLELFPKLSEKVFIANSGISKDKIMVKEDFIKSAYLSDHSTLKIVSVCNLIPRKNIDITLQALSTLSYVIDWHYTIIGDGPERERLEALVKSLAIDDKVTFMGYIENSKIYPYLDKSDVFIMVSALETFGLAYLEAMARGNIVIGTKGWGIDGIVTDGENGYLCEEISADNLINKIVKLLAMSSEEYCQMLYNIYRTVNKYTNEEMSQVYLNVIEQCILEHQENAIQSKVN